MWEDAVKFDLHDTIWWWIGLTPRTIVLIGKMREIPQKIEKSGVVDPSLTHFHTNLTQITIFVLLIL